jgi:GrpB-like predicted nucleotidyltransferase (UPF0157 family)
MTMPSPVILLPYDPAWPDVFERERRLLAEVFRDTDATIEHVGSTAIPGLGAKPVIDIMVGLPHLREAETRIEELERLGYEYVPQHEARLPDRRYFRKALNGGQPYHLHAVVRNGTFWCRLLIFRDHLRRHPDVAADYLALKRRLAGAYGADRLGYAEAKDSFVAAVVAAAEHDSRTA